MLNYSIQYDISNGIFLTFRRNLLKRTLKVSHGNAKRDKIKEIFPFQKYETYTKEDFIATCLYIMYTHYPSSMFKMLDYMREIDNQDVSLFKSQIIQYKSYINQDILRLREEYGSPTSDNVLKEFKKKNIKFYTTWFFFKINQINIEDYIQNNKVNGSIMQRIKQLMLFITFSQVAVDSIKILFEESDLIQNMS